MWHLRCIVLVWCITVVLVTVRLSEGVKLPEYRHHRLEDLCDGSKVELALHNKPTILTLNSSLQTTLKCHIELELHSDQFGFSVFLEYSTLDRTAGCKRDFYQFGRDFLGFTSHKSPRRCGTVEPTKRILRDDGSLLKLDYGATARAKREYIENVDKEMDLWLSVYRAERGQPPKQLRLVITPFKKECTRDDHYYKKCPSRRECIKRELFCDGQVNCGGEDKDEQVEYCLQHLGSTVDMFTQIPIVILIVVFSIVGLMFVLFLIKMFAVNLRRKRQPVRRIAEQSVSLCPPSGREGRGGMRALQAQLSMPPSAPLEEVLPPQPPSYTEAVSTPQTPLYPCDPPKYTELPQDHSTINYHHQLSTDHLINH